MSEPTSPEVAAELSPDEIALDEMRRLWPKDESGNLAKRLLLRYVNERLVRSLAGSDCGPMSAQAESGAGKAMAAMIIDFRSLGKSSPDKPARTATMKTLARFGGAQPSGEQPKPTS